MACAVPGAARTQGAPTDVSALRCWADWAGRPQERRADGVAMGARRLRPVASFHFERRVERSAAGRGTRDPGGQADRGRQRSPCRRRHGAAEEGVAFGRGRAPIRLGARQDRQLPDAGVADAGAGRGSGADRPAPVSAGELDWRPRPDGEGPRARELAGAAYEAGDRAGRDRSHPRRWRPVCDSAGGCRLWPVRAVPPRARRARPEVGGRNPQAAESLSDPCQAGVSDRRTRAAAQAPYSRSALRARRRRSRHREVATRQLA